MDVNHREWMKMFKTSAEFSFYALEELAIHF